MSRTTRFWSIFFVAMFSTSISLNFALAITFSEAEQAAQESREQNEQEISDPEATIQDGDESDTEQARPIRANGPSLPPVRYKPIAITARPQPARPTTANGTRGQASSRPVKLPASNGNSFGDTIMSLLPAILSGTMQSATCGVPGISQLASLASNVGRNVGRAVIPGSFQGMVQGCSGIGVDENGNVINKISRDI
jgi:hypothetical protein